MRQGVSMAGEAFARLRRRIAEIEAASVPADHAAEKTADDKEPAGPGGRIGGSKALRRPEGLAALAELKPGALTRAPDDARAVFAPRRAETALPFDIPAMDRLTGGGLRRNALHEIRAGETRDAGAAAGFATALLSRLAMRDDRRILWVAERTALMEGGPVYGRGLAHLGLDPHRLILAQVRSAADALWVFEEGLCCRGLAAVVAEVRGHPRMLDLTASRRLALRARASGVTGLFLRQADSATPGAATTRWQVAPRPAGITDDFAEGIGRPAWRLTLERNRHGATGQFDLEWNHDERCFALAGHGAGTTLPLGGAAPAADRPGAPPARRQELALAS